LQPGFSLDKYNLVKEIRPVRTVFIRTRISHLRADDLAKEITHQKIRPVRTVFIRTRISHLRADDLAKEIRHQKIRPFRTVFIPGGH